MKNIMLILLLLAGSLGFSQEKSKHERIKALKVSFLTEELALTPSEAQKFWPIYNSYDEKMHDLRRRERNLFKEKYSRSGSKNTLSEAEARNLIREYNEVVRQKYELESQLMDDLVKKLPSSKMVFLPEAERNFSKKLFEEYKKRKENNEKP